MNAAPPRWHLRLEHYTAAVAGVADAVERVIQAADDELIMAGAIQRFETCWELGWKLMRDYLRWAGNPVEVPVAINVIRAGFQANLIDDGDLWVAAMKDRNLMSHVYDPDEFRRIVARIVSLYLTMFQRLERRMAGERDVGH